MASTGKIFSIFVVLLLIGLAIFYGYYAIKFNRFLDNAIVTRGFGGKAGDKIDLVCPVGKTIIMTSAFYTCGDSSLYKTGSSVQCDPGNLDLNPSKGCKKNAINTLSTAANKKDKYSFTIPANITNICESCTVCPPTSVILTGTYDCVPK